MSTSCFSCVGHCDRILEHGSDLHVSVGRVRSSGEPLRLCSVLLPGLCWKVTPWSPHTVLVLGIACPFLSLGPSKKDVPTLLGVRGEEWHQMPVCGHKRLSLSLTVSGEEKAFHRSPPPPVNTLTFQWPDCILYTLKSILGREMGTAVIG